MIKKVFSVYDEKAKIFMTPFAMVEVGEALRMFMDLVRDQKTLLSRHPEDYKLYQLGTFDDFKGKYVNLDMPDFINNASDFVIKEVTK